MIKRGVIVGADVQCEWLLPWWWRHYSCHNDMPVTFFDFGLSEKAASWCLERGELISLDQDSILVAHQEEVDIQQRAQWEHLYGQAVWSVRKAWFCKPWACLKSPFEETLWLDLDCEVCGSVEPIFEMLDPQAEMGLCRSPSGFSSGVLVFRRQSQLMRQWAESCASQSALEIGDDNVLSSLLNHLSERRSAFQILPERFNWMGAPGSNLLLDLNKPEMAEALIIHWISLGKLFIETHGGYQDYRESYVLK